MLREMVHAPGAKSRCSWFVSYAGARPGSNLGGMRFAEQSDDTVVGLLHELQTGKWGNGIPRAFKEIQAQTIALAPIELR